MVSDAVLVIRKEKQQFYEVLRSVTLVLTEDGVMKRNSCDPVVQDWEMTQTTTASTT